MVPAVASTPAPPQLAFLADLSRALVRAARAWTLYPPSHPAATAPLDQLHRVVHDATALGPLRLSITPQALLIGESAVERPIPQIAEAAGFLHDRDLIALHFATSPSRAELRALLQLLKLDMADVRARGGPEAVWKEVGCPSITLRQVDYKALFENASEASGPARDDIWQSIVRTMRTRGTFGVDAQRRLLDVARDDAAMTALIDDVREPVCAADGSPLVSAQGLAVLHACARTATAVDLQTPDKLDHAIDVMATVASRLPPPVALEMLRVDEDVRLTDGSSVQARVAASMSDQAMGTLLAEAVTREGAAERVNRLVQLATSQATRRDQVIDAAKVALARRHEHEPRRLEALTDALMRLGADPTGAHTPAQYEQQLARSGARAHEMSLSAMPDELPGWLETIQADHIRRLTVTLISDLLRFEETDEGMASLIDELRVIAEDLLLATDFAGTHEVVTILETRVSNGDRGHRAARAAMQQLATGAALQEATSLLDAMPDDGYRAFRDTCRLLGPMAVESLRAGLTAPGPISTRLADLIGDHGAAALARLAPLALHHDARVQQKIAALVGRIGLPEGVPILERLLRSNHDAVVLEAARVLTCLDDPAAARAFQAFVRSLDRDRQAGIVAVLLTNLHPSSVLSLIEILERCDALGADWHLALDLLDGLARLADARAVPVVARIMRQRRRFRPGRTRALRRAAIAVLTATGTAGATAALRDGSRTGDRMLRRMARAVLPEVDARSAK